MAQVLTISSARGSIFIGRMFFKILSRISTIKNHKKRSRISTIKN